MIRGRQFRWWHEIVLAVLLVALFLVTAQLMPNFISLHSQIILSKHIWETAILALGMTLIVITGGIDLSVGAQLTIIFTVVLASIATPAVPGAGLVMLIIVLESVGLPTAAIGLVLGLDRILDMIRTPVNITGDAIVAVVVASAEGEIGEANIDEYQDRIRIRRQET